MRKFTLMVLAIVLSFAILASACSATTTEKNQEEKIQDQTDSQEQVVDAYQDTKGKTLSYWYPMWQWEADFVGNGDMGDLWIYKEIEKVTGVKIKWIHPPIADADAIAALNVLFASSDLPDIITHPYYTYYPGGSDKAIADGVYLDSKDLMKEYSPNYWKLLVEDPESLRNVTTDEGNIWCYYMIDSFAQKSYGGLIYRKDFLDQLGAEVPTTIDELHDLLKRFKDELKLERPIQFPSSGHSGNNRAIISAYGVCADYYNDNSIVKYGPIEDGFREYLREMNKWYKEGLIAKDFVAPPKTEVVMTDGTAGCYIGGFNNITEYTNMAKDVPGYALVSGPYPTLNKGEKVDFKLKTYRTQQNCTAITTSCKEPWVAAKWLDVKFTDEFKIKGNYGEEGVTFNWVDGKPAYTDYAINNPENTTLGIFLYKVAFGKGPYYRIQDRNWFTHLPHAVEAMDIWDDSSTGKAELPEPFLTMPVKEGEKFSAIMADINNYVGESIIKFITGELSIDNDWDSYISTIKSMGIEEALQYKQAAYDRYLKRPV